MSALVVAMVCWFNPLNPGAPEGFFTVRLTARDTATQEVIVRRRFGYMFGAGQCVQFDPIPERFDHRSMAFEHGLVWGDWHLYP